MLGPGKLDRAFDLLKERKAEREEIFKDTNIEANLEKNDFVAMLISALLTFLPLVMLLLAIALYCLYS